MNLFLSCATQEFGSYRSKLKNRLLGLREHRFTIYVQEDFRTSGFTLLEKLAECVRACDMVIHLAGTRCGARPAAEHVRLFYQKMDWEPVEPLPDLSYTQWEYELARRFERPVLCYFATDEAPRDPSQSSESKAEAELQRRHIARIKGRGQHRSNFSSYSELDQIVSYDLGVQDGQRVNNLPYASIGSLFKGREGFLAGMRQRLGALEHAGRRGMTAITAKAPVAAVYGMGGIGKTRAVIEYAHRYKDEYTAQLFVLADSPSSLESNLAALCGAAVLDLKEKEEREIRLQVEAVLRWLKNHVGWFLILDNVDSEEAAHAVNELFGQLADRGHIVLTSRLSRWGQDVEPLELDLLDEDSSAAYLLEATERGRLREDGEKQTARMLAVDELGQLALALEQAAAYINARQCSFTAYLERWRRNRARMMDERDSLTMKYPQSIAITWLTSFEQLSKPAQELLDLFSWFASSAIPRSVFSDFAHWEGFAMAKDCGTNIEDEQDDCREDFEKSLAEISTYSLGRVHAI